MLQDSLVGDGTCWSELGEEAAPAVPGELAVPQQQAAVLGGGQAEGHGVQRQVHCDARLGCRPQWQGRREALDAGLRVDGLQDVLMLLQGTGLDGYESSVLTIYESSVLTIYEPLVLTSYEPSVLTSYEPSVLTSYEPSVLTR